MTHRLVAWACAFALASIALAARAHVRIEPPSVAPGTVAHLTFRCPNERANASTVKLEVQLPGDVPLATVTVLPVAGWRSTVTMRVLATPLHTPRGDATSVVDTITWQGGSLAPGAVGRFPIDAGPIPAGRPLVFKALQTYDNGEVVRWIQERAPGEAEPPFPAPSVAVSEK